MKVETLAVKNGEPETMEPEGEVPETWDDKHITFFGPDTRTILVGSDIDDKLSNAVVSQIFELIARDHEKPIKVFINTNGGSVSDALAIYDSLRLAPNPIVTIVTGQAASAGLMICAAGDLRLCFEHSQFFYHSVISNTQTVTELDSEEFRAHYRWCTERNTTIIRGATNLRKREWDREFGDRTSKYFYADDALRIGLIHKVIPSAKVKKFKEDFLA